MQQQSFNENILNMLDNQSNYAFEYHLKKRLRKLEKNRAEKARVKARKLLYAS